MSILKRSADILAAGESRTGDGTRWRSCERVHNVWIKKIFATPSKHLTATKKWLILPFGFKISFAYSNLNRAQMFAHKRVFLLQSRQWQCGRQSFILFNAIFRSSDWFVLYTIDFKVLREYINFVFMCSCVCQDFGSKSRCWNYGTTVSQSDTFCGMICGMILLR